MLYANDIYKKILLCDVEISCFVNK